MDLDSDLHWKKPELHKQLWNKRCQDCMICCNIGNMPGYCLNEYKIDESIEFWNHEFVVIQIRDNDRDNELINMICPLGTIEGCLINEDKPKLCKLYFCKLKMKYEGYN